MSSGEVFRVLAEMGPRAWWMVMSFAGIIAAFPLCLGITMIASMVVHDDRRREMCYRMFHDLVELCEVVFRRGGKR